MKFGMYTLYYDKIPKINKFPDFPIFSRFFPDNPDFQFYGDFRA